MQTIDQFIAASCVRHENRCALQHKPKKNWVDINYRDLWQQVEAIASGLNDLGLKAAEHIAILAPSSPAWVTCYLAILRSGTVAIPVDKELKAAELKHILADSESKLIFTAPQQLETLLEIAPTLPRLKHIVLLDAPRTEAFTAEDTPELLQEVASVLEELENETALNEEQREKIRTLEQKLKPSGQEPGSRYSSQADLLGLQEESYRQLRNDKVLLFLEELYADIPLPPASHEAEACAVILYTSGTTGRSKGAMLSHANIVSNIQAASKHFGLDSSIHTLSFLPINHVFEQVCGVLLPLSLGGKVSFAESIKKLGDNLNEVKPTFLLGVPAVYRLLYDRIMKNVNAKAVSRVLFRLPLGRNLVTSKIRKVFGRNTIFVSGGAALDPAVATGFAELGLTLLQGYGITETSPVIAAETPGRRKAGTVGLPLEKVVVRIDTPNAEGAGEIQVKGPNVMLGYYKNEQASGEVLQDGWYRTGDLGTLDQDGMLSICGRVKNLIVTPNGKNVYPEEVENHLLNSPYIAEIMVYGHKVSATAEEVYASIFPCEEALFEYQQQQSKGPLSPDEVEELIRKEVLSYGKDLADYKRVKKFSLREDEFPKTTTRKIKRYVLEPEIAIEG